MEAVRIYQQKNGKYKVLFTTPGGATRTIGKFDNAAEAEKLKTETVANVAEYYKPWGKSVQERLA